MYKNIVFDMGNVLIMFYPEKTLKKYLDDEEDISLIIKEFYGSRGYREVDRGTLTYKDLLESLKGVLPERLTELLDRLYVKNCFGKTEMPVFPEMYDVVSSLREKGYKTYLLSNAGKDFYDYSKYIPAIGIMDGAVVSSDYGLLKPEKEIYETLFKKYDLTPEECLFIDDTEENIKGAEKCGMEGIVFSPSFQSVSVLKDKLREKGVDI